VFTVVVGIISRDGWKQSAKTNQLHLMEIGGDIIIAYLHMNFCHGEKSENYDVLAARMN